jgi:hypothetical protein
VKFKGVLTVALVSLLLTGAGVFTAPRTVQAAPAPTVVTQVAMAKVSCGQRFCLADECPGLGCSDFGLAVPGNLPRNQCYSVTAVHNISIVFNQTSSPWNMYRTSTCGGATMGVAPNQNITDAFPSQWPNGWDNAVVAVVRRACCGS